MITKIVSGGQTGVDRAALDVAIKLGIPHGGWCPKGRKALDGIIPEQYQLKEAPSEDYKQRTLLNNQESDATLIVHTNELFGPGTRYTISMARQLKRPVFYTRVDVEDFDKFFEWLDSNIILILNVAGSRETNPGGKVYLSAYHQLMYLLTNLKNKQ